MITEAYDLKLGRSAMILGPGRVVVSKNGARTISAIGSMTVLGTYREGVGGVLRYDGCTFVVTEIDCGMVSEVIHDACPDGPRSCRQCRKLRVGYRPTSGCALEVTSPYAMRGSVHDCAPCEPDGLGDALPELQHELVGRELVTAAVGPSFFATRKGCEASSGP